MDRARRVATRSSSQAKPWRLWAHSKYDAVTPPALARMSGTTVIPAIGQDGVGLRRGRAVGRLDHQRCLQRAGPRPRRWRPRARRGHQLGVDGPDVVAADRLAPLEAGDRARRVRRGPRAARRRGRPGCTRHRPRRPRPRPASRPRTAGRRGARPPCRIPGPPPARRRVACRAASKAARTQRTTPEAVAPVCRRIPPTASGLPVTDPGLRAPTEHVEGVHAARP